MPTLNSVNCIILIMSLPVKHYYYYRAHTRVQVCVWWGGGFSILFEVKMLLIDDKVPSGKKLTWKSTANFWFSVWIWFPWDDGDWWLEVGPRLKRAESTVRYDSRRRLFSKTRSITRYRFNYYYNKIYPTTLIEIT